MTSDEERKKEILEHLKVIRPKIDILAKELSERRTIYSSLVTEYKKLDRRIFEQTKGITKIGRGAQAIKKKETPRTLEELSDAERATLLKQLLEIQERRKKRR